jgi:hypothetical protein
MQECTAINGLLKTVYELIYIVSIKIVAYQEILLPTDSLEKLSHFLRFYRSQLQDNIFQYS